MHQSQEVEPLFESTAIVDPFVRDFCAFWEHIHTEVIKRRVRKISKTAEITQALKDVQTIRFYEKYKSHPLLEYSEAWMKTLGSFSILWYGGRVLIPLRLVTYELAYAQDQLLHTFLKNISTNQIQGNEETLFRVLFPKLLEMALPLSKSDLILLKGFQTAYIKSQNRRTGPSTQTFAYHIPELNAETIRNKLEYFRYFQLAIPMHFLDMGKLGYETYLTVHSSMVPDQLSRYCLIDINMGSARLGLFQLPYSRPELLTLLKSTQSEEYPTPSKLIPMTRRVHSWNLSTLQEGKNKWIKPYSFFYGDPSSPPQFAPATMDMSLDPLFQPFRPLTHADVILLSFLVSVGKILRLKDLASQVQLHPNTVSRLLAEYQKAGLLNQIVQYYNLGLNLPVYLFISIPNTTNRIHFLDFCLTLPHIDLFTTTTTEESVYFGRTDLPHFWCRDFVTRLQFLRNKYSEMSFHYTFEPPLVIRRNLSLMDTYQQS